MLKFCKKTCKACKTNRPCQDSSEREGRYCQQWKKAGYCSSQRKHMLKFCKKTCKACEINWFKYNLDTQMVQFSFFIFCAIRNYIYIFLNQEPVSMKPIVKLSLLMPYVKEHIPENFAFSHCISRGYWISQFQNSREGVLDWG